MNPFRARISLAAIAALVACSESPFEPARTAEDGPGAVAASMPLTYTSFTATDVPVQLTDPGHIQITSGKFVLTGLAGVARIEATDPRLTGFASFTANGVLDATDGHGPVWGTLTVHPDIGGEGTGTWHGHRAPSGPVWIGNLAWTLNGVGGPVAGLHASGTEVITSFSLIPTAYFGAMSGTIRSNAAAGAG